MKFEVMNVKCESCANLIKNALSDEFGEISVDVANKSVSLDIKESEVDKFKNEMQDLGFSVASRIN